jgi:hypothetical protein
LPVTIDVNIWNKLVSGHSAAVLPFKDNLKVSVSDTLIPDNFKTDGPVASFMAEDTTSNWTSPEIEQFKLIKFHFESKSICLFEALNC